MHGDATRNSFPFALSEQGYYSRVVTELQRFVHQVGAFHSPFGLIPHLAQLMGLSTPDSGRSGYSLYAISHQLNEKGDHEALWTIPLDERRRIVDELYAYIAPVVLGEQRAFADSQARILASFGHSTAEGASGWKQALLQRMAIATPVFESTLGGQPGFAHIAHYGHPADLCREYPYLLDASAEQAALWDDSSFPTTVEIEFKGLARRGEQPRTVHGWVIIVGNTTERMLADRTLRERKLNQAVHLADKLGAKIVGMAGLVASFARGGRIFSGRVPGVGFTTGHAYTILNVVRVMRRAVELAGLDLRRATVAVVGAAGSIGSGCAKLLAEQGGLGRLLLVDLTSIVSGAQLARIVEDLARRQPDLAVDVTSDLRDLQHADVLLVATSAPRAFLESSHLAPGAIIVDDSFPKNVPRDLLDGRPDVLLLEGGLVQLPYPVYVSAAKHMPDLLDAPVTRMGSCRETYGCFSETLLLACEERYRNFGIGPASTDLAHEIGRLAEGYGFGDAPLQCYDDAINPERVERCRQALSKRGLIL